MISINVVRAFCFTIALLVSNCAADAYDKVDATNTPGRETVNASVQSADYYPTPDAVMDGVALTYSKIEQYKGKGLSEFRRLFDGAVTDEAKISLDVYYARGRGATLRWSQDTNEYLLTIDGKESWLDLDGNREHTYATTREALMAGPHAKGGWSFFHLRTFIFRQELQLDNKFFTALVGPKVIGEDIVDGRSCYLLRGSYADHTSHTYWVDKENYLIRRIEQTIIFRKMFEGKEYVSTATTTENHSDIEVTFAGSKPAAKP